MEFFKVINFFRHCGLDRNMRERYRGHPHFERTANFCYRYDQNSFDPSYESLPLEAFVPIVQKLFSAPRRGIYLAG